MSMMQPSEWKRSTIAEEAVISTGAKNTQDREANGRFPFFIRSQGVERINSWSFDGEAVLTAGDGVNTGRIFHYIDGKFDFHQRVYKISHFSPRLDGRFFYYWFSGSFYKRVAQMTAKSSVDSVRREMIAEMEMPLPPPEEQRAIAGVLSDVDALIESLDALIAKKRDLKQATMQQLLTGKKRLLGFSREWKVVLLPEKVWFQEGPGLRNWQFTSNGMKVINVTNLSHSRILDLTRTDRHIATHEFDRMYKHFAIDEGDIVMASSGNSYCKISVVRNCDLPLMMNTSVIRFKARDGYNSRFLLCYLSSKYFKEQIDLMITGGAQPNFGPVHLKQVKLPCPQIEEQTAIAEILSDMDAEIDALIARREKNKLLKTGLMQELLSGRRRLV
jgi:type I restriction enzyme S subunit